MKRDQFIQTVREHQEELNKKFRVATLSIFGSIAREEATDNSDVDILVSFEKTPGLFEFIELKEYLENLFNRPVDLVTKKALKRQFVDQVLEEAIDAI